MKKLVQYLQYIAWVTTTTTVLIAFIAWGQGMEWQFGELSIYKLFPLLGLLAFSILWSQYVIHALKLLTGAHKNALKQYFEITGMIVLALILFHPGLLAFELWRDGAGLPPGSYGEYVGSAMTGTILLGEISLLLFLSYQLKRKFEDKPWWRYFGYATDFAMILVLIHSLRLGSDLQSSWLRIVWYFYGITLFASLVYIYSKRSMFIKKP